MWRGEKKRSCRGCGGRKHQTGVCFSFSVELPVPTISSWYYCLRQRRTWSGRLCLRSTLETFTQTTQGKKRELNCSPPQGNCWSGAFAKYLRSTSSLTSKSWLGEETVSSVGLSPNCGLVNSEGGTWARTPGRYQLLDHGGTGGRGGLWRWRHTERPTCIPITPLLFSLSLFSSSSLHPSTPLTPAQLRC